MQLPLQDFSALVRNQAAAVARSARTLIDLSVGSVLRTVLEANASVALWMQWLIMDVLSATRAATSLGADLDSWVADFGMSRLGAVASSAEVTFSRATPGLQAVVPVGAVVRTGSTADGQAFAVVGDASRTGWTGSGYRLDAAQFDVTVPMQALVAGRAGNVHAGALRLLATPVPGIDTVSNANAAVSGMDAESDIALRSRFGNFIDSRARGTSLAVTFAIQSVQQGLAFLIADRVDAAGAVRDGHFTVVLDDGSGSPPDALMQAVGDAVERVRPLGVTYSVVRPTLTVADVSLQVAAPAEAMAAVRDAVVAYIAGLQIGEWLITSRVVQAAHEADGRVVRVGEVVVNGLASDLLTAQFGRIVAGQVSVSS